MNRLYNTDTKEYVNFDDIVSKLGSEWLEGMFYVIAADGNVVYNEAEERYETDSATAHWFTHTFPSIDMMLAEDEDFQEFFNKGEKKND